MFPSTIVIWNAQADMTAKFVLIFDFVDNVDVYVPKNILLKVKNCLAKC